MRYVSIAPDTAEWYDEHRCSHSLARTVHEDDGKPIYTCLLDAGGVKLYRVPDIEPIGFVRHQRSAGHD